MSHDNECSVPHLHIIALFTKSTLSPHHPQDHEHEGAENDATAAW